MTLEMKEKINKLAEELNEMWLDAPEDSIDNTSWHLIAQHVIASELRARMEEIRLHPRVFVYDIQRVKELQQQLEQVEGV